MNSVEPLCVPRSLYGWVAALPKDGRAVARLSEDTRNLEFVMHRTPLSFLSGRAIAGWIVAFVLMAVAGTASAQVTAISSLTGCNSPVLRSPSSTNGLRIQTGKSEFELWGNTAVNLKQPATMSFTAIPTVRTVTILATRTATQNSARGCPAQPSVAVSVSNSDSLASQINGTLSIPLPGGTSQRIPLSVLPHPNIGWIWVQVPVGATQGICTVPSFEFQYVSNTVLSLKIPFDNTLGLECTQRLASRLIASPVDAHIVGPTPVRLTTPLTDLAASDLPVPIAPESMPTQIDRRTGVTVGITLSKNGVLRRQRDFPLVASTPNGKTAQIMVSIVRKPEERKITISTRSAAGETPDAITGTAIDFTFGIQPAVEEFSLPITWRVTNPACFAAVSGPYNPANPFQVFNLQQGGTIFNIRVTALHTAACIPPDGGRTETIQAWAGTDTSVPPAGTVTFKVFRNPSL